MSIEIGSKWVKNGEMVEVTNIIETVGRDEVIYYKCEQGKEHILYDYDFLEQYKPYEVVYEWQWVFIKESGNTLSEYMTLAEFDMKMNNWVEKNCNVSWEKVEKTKRERK